jgi:hypothetical protein
MLMAVEWNSFAHLRVLSVLTDRGIQFEFNCMLFAWCVCAGG